LPTCKCLCAYCDEIATAHFYAKYASAVVIDRKELQVLQERKGDGFIRVLTINPFKLIR
jgi:hypothetical protein